MTTSEPINRELKKTGEEERTVSESRKRSGFWFCLSLLCMLDLLKHGLTFLTGPTVLIFDAVEYWQRGSLVASGDILQVHGAVNFRGPIYPLLVGLCQSWFDQNALLSLALIQHFFQMVAAVFVAVSCWWITKQRLPVLMGYGICVVSITGPWYSNVVLTESLFQLAMTVTFAAVVLYHLHPSYRHACLFALVLGIAIQIRPIPKLLWIPVFASFLLHALPFWAIQRVRFFLLVQHILVAGGVLFLCVAPWSIRNWMLFDNSSVASVPPINKWVVCFHYDSAADLPIPRSLAGNQLRKHLPSIDEDDLLRRDGYTVIRKLQDAGLMGDEINQLVSQVCQDAIAANPAKFFWRFSKRLGNFWRCPVNQYPYYSTFPQKDGDWERDLMGQTYWRNERVSSIYEALLRRTPSTQLRFVEFVSLLCALGTSMLVVHRKTRILGVSMVLIFLYFSGITAALEVESYRYRMVLEPIMAVSIACGIFGRQDKLRP